MRVYGILYIYTYEYVLFSVFLKCTDLIFPNFTLVPEYVKQEEQPKNYINTKYFWFLLTFLNFSLSRFRIFSGLATLNTHFDEENIT